MKIKVKVRTKAKKDKVEKLADGTYKLWTTEPARGNKANFAVIELIAEYFGVKKNQVFIVKGEKSKKKELRVMNYR